MIISCTLLLCCLVCLVRPQCSGGILASEVNGFLTSHNRLRQSISSGSYVAKGRRMPAAKIPIPNLTWDCGLERSAQSVASACRFDHSDYSNYLGENLFMSGGSFYGQGKAASDAWESEFQVYGWPDVRFTRVINDSGVGHATQMAWARSTRMGCGLASCQGGRVLVVCHYRDSGNYIGQNVYEPAGAVGPSSDAMDDDSDSGMTVGELFKNFLITQGLSEQKHSQTVQKLMEDHGEKMKDMQNKREERLKELKTKTFASASLPEKQPKEQPGTRT